MGLHKKKFIFVSCAFDDERYIEQLDRLRESIRFKYTDEQMYFNRGSVAKGALSMNDSLYGFKPHAIKPHLDTHDYVIWCDPAMMLVTEIDDLLAITDANGGVYAVKDDNKLHTCISDLALEHWDFTREDVKSYDWNLVGGSLYVFNSNMPVAMQVFDDWLRSEMMGIFGSAAQAASGRIQGHRNDETCMAMAMYTNGLKPIDYDVARYNDVSNPIMIKKHFK